MKPILNKEIVLQFIAEKNKGNPDTTTTGLAKQLGRQELLMELLDLTENHI